MNIVEPYEGYRAKARAPYRRRKTDDPAILAYRAELEKRGLLKEKTVGRSGPGYAPKPTCKRGHPNIPENRRFKANGKTDCKLCEKERNAGLHRKAALPNYGKRKSAA